jgi:hypothetical protein
VSDTDAASAWLTDPRGAVWCRASPGLIAVELVELDVEPGCEAAFAASWAALFDQSLTPPAGCVTFAERQACEAAVAPPPDAGMPATVEEERRERAPWLGALAALAALCAVLVGTRR